MIYLTHTKSDMAYAVGVLSRYMNKTTRIHVGAGKRVLRYLAGIMDYGLWYAYSSECKLEGYTYSDWTRSLEDRRSTYVVIFRLGSATISWMSKK